MRWSRQSRSSGSRVPQPASPLPCKPAAAAVLASTYELCASSCLMSRSAALLHDSSRSTDMRHRFRRRSTSPSQLTTGWLLARIVPRLRCGSTGSMVRSWRERAWYAAQEKYDEALAQMEAAGVAAMAMCTEALHAAKTAQEEVRAASPRPNPNTHPNPNPNQRDESGDEEAWDDTYLLTQMIHRCMCVRSWSRCCAPLR
eukprot:scaffold364_cov47-Phaeocystis_antarctica.AAC.4